MPNCTLKKVEDLLEFRTKFFRRRYSYEGGLDESVVGAFILSALDREANWAGVLRAP